MSDTANAKTAHPQQQEENERSNDSVGTRVHTHTGTDCTVAPSIASRNTNANVNLLPPHALVLAQVIPLAWVVLLASTGPILLCGPHPAGCAPSKAKSTLSLCAWFLWSPSLYFSSWCIVAQGMFTFREVNQMESEMCNYLDWELTVVDPILSNFEITVKNDFREMKPTYPNYPTTFVSKRAARAEASTTNTPFDEKSNTTSPVPGFTTARNTAPAAKMTPERLLRRLGAPICFQTYCQSRGLDVQHSLR